MLPGHQGRLARDEPADHGGLYARSVQESIAAHTPTTARGTGMIQPGGAGSMGAVAPEWPMRLQDGTIGPIHVHDEGSAPEHRSTRSSPGNRRVQL